MTRYTGIIRWRIGRIFMILGFTAGMRAGQDNTGTGIGIRQIPYGTSMVCGVAPSPRPLSRDCTVTMVTQWQHDVRASCSQSLSNWPFKKSPDAPH